MDKNSDIFVKKQWFIKSNLGKLEDFYEFDTRKILGSGTYGNVYKAKKKDSKIVRAVKQIPKSKVKNAERFKREIEIMRTLDHPNIIKLYETFEDERNIYLVMEVCEGGELFDRIIEKGRFTEIEARSIFSQIMQAINYCHNNGIAHRDLKPENFLFLTKHDDSPIKVIDFGLSKNFDNKQAMKTKAGTPYYISPEVLEGNYDESCDIWSAGVILYILLSGVPPFFGDDDSEILASVKKGFYTFDIPEFEGISNSAKDLIQNMVTKPEKRFKADQVLSHPWMKEDIKQKNKQLPLNFNALKNFTQHHKLKKVALSFIASQLSENEISDLGKLFRQLDKNGDGTLTVDEIREGLAGTNDKNIEEVRKVISSIDTDGSGKIDYTEFLAATMEKSLYMKEDKLHQAFKMLDIDGNGKISKEELKQILGKELGKYDEAYWDNMIKEVDKNGDGEIDYNEFIDMMNTISFRK
ncbi:calmodulin-domain kinase (macronuclear) [Tetrahymena thermophila SB210]|uniref:Calcium-dependent protein kinase 1 n=1 Tax=Tetrahymena thermophila (strain SB210) TaxID=312017 RepID=Q22AS9_TETTS|nr:calmodulin-domain kinase [Tetrahymena thermophila SB210]EAR82389.1 calmodulin-domain kinase [Tetrahymena thermophila SB210]|eukprot:XP_001030052.1 calmodulin-domain kinase [Tetrahymena thermophila SB210]